MVPILHYRHISPHLLQVWRQEKKWPRPATTGVNLPGGSSIEFLNSIQSYNIIAGLRILVTGLPLLSRYSKTCKALGCGYVQDKMRDAFRREKSSTREPSSYNLVVGFSSRVFEGNGSGRARWGCIYSYLLPVSLYVETLLGIWKWRQMRGYFQITSCVITRTHPDFWLYHISRHTSIISVGIPINILSSYYHIFQ